MIIKNYRRTTYLDDFWMLEGVQSGESCVIHMLAKVKKFESGVGSQCIDANAAKI